LSNINSALSQYFKHAMNLYEKEDLIRGKKDWWKLRTKNIIIPQHREMPPIIKYFQMYKAKYAM
jgi:hypothetical protein